MQSLRWSRAVLKTAGLVVGLGGMYGLILLATGRTTPAVVTQAMHFVNPDANETAFSYVIHYQFAVHDRHYSGRASRKNVRDVRQLPGVGSLLEVRYLPVAPSLNQSADVSPVRDVIIGALSLILVGLSLALRLRPAGESACMP